MNRGECLGRTLGRIILSGLMVLLLVGCTNRLAPPDNLEDPVRIYLLDHGDHPSLVLPDDDDGWVRYAHGEWRWYVERETGLMRGLQALFWPTAAAVGRRTLSSLPEPGQFSELVPEGYVGRYGMNVERERMLSLRETLDGYFDDAEDIRYQSAFNLEFAPYPRSYWVFHNSNRSMVIWLDELDVGVRGSGLFSNWHLMEDDTR